MKPIHPYTRLFFALACAVGSSLAIVRAEDPKIHYLFSPANIRDGRVVNLAGKQHEGVLRAGVTPQENNGVGFLQFDGKTGFVEVQNSENLHIGDKGMTIVATVRLRESPKPDFGMFAGKLNEYVFATRHNKVDQALYANIRSDAGVWPRAEQMLGGNIAYQQWAHVAVIFNRLYDPSQGVVGYRVTQYLNGKPASIQTISNNTGARNSEPLLVGKGFGGGNWFLKGDMAELRVYDRALEEGEFRKLLEKEKLAKVYLPHEAKPDPGYAEALRSVEAALQSKMSPQEVSGWRRWLRNFGLALGASKMSEGEVSSCKGLLAAVDSARKYAETEAQLIPALKTIAALLKAGETNLVAAFSAAHPEFRFLQTDVLLMGFYQPTVGKVYWSSLFDLKRNEELLGKREPLWALSLLSPGDTQERQVDALDESLESRLEMDAGQGTATLRWKAETLETKVNFVLAGPRLEMEMSVENGAGKNILDKVRFPDVALRRWSKDSGQMFLPFYSGQVTDLRSGYSGNYPSARATMQYFAYYDAGRGVYLGIEDPAAQPKELAASGFDEKSGKFSALWWVGAPEGKGGNGFRSSGKAVMEVFDGDWFDATRIYERFVRTAPWWPTSPTRKDTPDWYRDLTLWFRVDHRPADTNWEVERQLRAFRDYLGLPIGTHLYSWHEEPFNAMFPKYTPRPGLDEFLKRSREAGIYIKPYMNVLIWSQALPDHDTKALPSAVKDRQQKTSTQTYDGPFTVMCPTCPDWQDTVAGISKTIASYGAPAVYLDQLGASAPDRCFDPTHPHAPGSGSAWVEEGYWPMVRKIREETRAAFPETTFDSEDLSEPFAAMLDGVLPWRAGAMRAGEVPAFQSIYAGHLQFVGREGWREISKFGKTSRQLLYAEQIGWFRPNDVESDQMFRLFVKKLAHTRHAFLPFFNGGSMLKPMGYEAGATTVTSDWGYRSTLMETTPAVMHSVWEKDGVVAAIFVNTTHEEKSVSLVPPAGAWGVENAPLTATFLTEGSKPQEYSWKPGDPVKVTVPGYGIAAWIIPKKPGAGISDIRAKVEPLFAALAGFEKEAAVTADSKRIYVLARNPWWTPEDKDNPLNVIEYQNDSPGLQVSQWFPAAGARRVQGAQVVASSTAPTPKVMGHIKTGAFADYGRVDLGPAKGGKLWIEVEVGVDKRWGGVLGIYAARNMEGVELAKQQLEETGGFTQFKTQRFLLAPGTEGINNLIFQFSGGAGSGIGNFSRWRVVREDAPNP